MKKEDTAIITNIANSEFTELTKINIAFDEFTNSKTLTPSNLFPLVNRINDYHQQFCGSDSLLRILLRLLKAESENLPPYQDKLTELEKCQRITETYRNYCWQSQQSDIVTDSILTLQQQLANYICALRRVVQFSKDYKGEVSNKASVVQFLSSLLLILQSEDEILENIAQENTPVLQTFEPMFNDCFANCDAFLDFLGSDVSGNDLTLYYLEIITPLSELRDQINEICNRFDSDEYNDSAKRLKM